LTVSFSEINERPKNVSAPKLNLLHRIFKTVATHLETFAHDAGVVVPASPKITSTAGSKNSKVAVKCNAVAKAGHPLS